MMSMALGSAPMRRHVLAGIGALVAATLAGCASQPLAQHSARTPSVSQAATSSPTVQASTSSPTDLAGAAASQEKQDRFSAADFAGEWLLFTKDLRDNISQETFVEYSQACSAPAKSHAGLNAQVSGSRLDSPGRAIIRFQLLGVTYSVTMVYEYGGWYKEPDQFLRSNYGKTAAELIAADKAVGKCQAA
jgi:hypothetical protein